MARRNKEDEKLDDANLDRVIKLLEQDKPISKKDACAMLCIAYNTTRLASLIEKHKEAKERDAKHRAAKRGKPATPDEVNFIITSYLQGSPIDSISKYTYRGSAFIKNVLESNSVPIRSKAYSYFKPELIPDGASRDRFAIGEVVYSARYDALAKIRSEQAHPDGYVYLIFVNSEDQPHFAYQGAWDLASLEHLREKGIKI